MKDLIKLNFGELEQLMWTSLQDTFQQAMVKVLSMLDVYLMSKRDPKRYELKGIKERNCITMLGPVKINRRYYWDRDEGDWVFLLDRALELAPKKQISVCLKELVVLWATKGPSYRDSRDRLEDLFGHQVVSHETIRQQLIRSSEILREKIVEEPARKRVKILFVEADGLWTGIQRGGRKAKGKRETFLVVVHEGWEIRQGSGDKADYRLKNPMYITVLANDGDDIWEQVMLKLCGKYEWLSETQFVINGDFAPWIRGGAGIFRKAIYQYDRFHLKRGVKQILGNSKEYIAQALDCVNQNNTDGLFETIGKAAEKTKCMDEKQKLLRYRWNLQMHADALVDYRERLRRQGVDVSPSWRGMGAAESNVDLFKTRTAKRGRAWSERGIKAISHMLCLLHENVLQDCIKQLDLSLGEVDTGELIAASAGQVARAVGRGAIGVPQAGFPAIHKGSSQGFAKLFRDILNPDTPVS